MSIERVFFLKESGINVLFRKRKGVRRLTIRIKKEGEVIVTLPFLVSFREAEKFLLSRQKWVEETRKKVVERNPKQCFSYGNILETHYHSVFIEKTDKTSFSQQLCHDNLYIYIPEKEDILNEKVQTYIKNRVIELLRKEAKMYLPVRLRQLAEENSYIYKSVRIKNMKTRWGSCSSVNNINLNLHLMRLPYEYIDYVILHELVHTVEKHHGPTFWDTLNMKFPSAGKLSKIIRKISPEEITMIKN